MNIDSIVTSILDDYKEDRIINRTDITVQPDRDKVLEILDKLTKMIFPGYFREKNYKFYNLNSRLTVLTEDVIYNLKKQVAISLIQKPEYENASYDERVEASEEITEKFMMKLPDIRALIETDVQAFFDGDPASYNHSEIILCYPGLRAIVTARLAHELFVLGVPLIPRMMTDHAHSRTGIDIHPGATIG